jgi:phosphomannomutase
MSTQAIVFGTDGWRAIIADQYTFENLERVTRATADWLRATYGRDAAVVIGHDTRFMGREFSEHVASVFAEEGIRSTVSDDFTTTPAISWATAAYGAQAGIVITASHNPPQYNGFKIKAHFGGPASPEMIADVESRIPDSGSARVRTLADSRAGGFVTTRQITADYMGVLSERIDLDGIRRSGIRVAHDAMYGAGQGVIAGLLGEDRVVQLHATRNPGFMGRAPEPIESNLKELAATVVAEGCGVGIAIDGDADRVGMFDEQGGYVNSHLLLALLVKYLHEERGLNGSIVKTFSTTHMLDRMGDAYDLPVETTRIGFKYIASKIVDGDVLVGGEESGGMAVKGHIPERDGIYIGLLVTEMLVRRSKPLSALVQELYDQFGPHYTYRFDAHTTEEAKQGILRRLAEEGGLDTIGGAAVRDFQTLDGFKHIVDGGWLLVRPSGTEPVLRIYSEAKSAAAATELVNDAQRQLGLEVH